MYNRLDYRVLRIKKALVLKASAEGFTKYLDDGNVCDVVKMDVCCFECFKHLYEFAENGFIISKKLLNEYKNRRGIRSMREKNYSFFKEYLNGLNEKYPEYSKRLYFCRKKLLDAIFGRGQFAEKNGGEI